MCIFFLAWARPPATKHFTQNAQGHTHEREKKTTYPKLWKSSRMVIMCLTIVSVVDVVLLVVLGLMGIFTGIIYHSRFHGCIQIFTFPRLISQKSKSHTLLQWHWVFSWISVLIPHSGTFSLSHAQTSHGYESCVLFYFVDFFCIFSNWD